MTKHYKYVGADPFLVGMTALGQYIHEVFRVQVDALNHPWTTYWHETPPEEWQVDGEEPE